MDWKFKVWNRKDKEMEDNTWLHQTDAYGDIGFLDMISPKFCEEHGLDYRILPFIGMETVSKQDIYIGDILRLEKPAETGWEKIRKGHFEVEGLNFKTIPGEVTRIQRKCEVEEIDEVTVVVRQPEHLGFTADVYWRAGGVYGSSSHLANRYLSALIDMGAEVIGNVFENPDLIPGCNGEGGENFSPEWKFRVWDDKLKEMHDFAWIVHEDMEGSIPFLSMASMAVNMDRGWDYRVMPYIGYQTNQNKEVYVGDILMIKYPFELPHNEPDTMVMIIRESETWGFNVNFCLGRDGSFKEVRRLKGFTDHFVEYIRLGAEVVGNVFETPFLDPLSLDTDLCFIEEQEKLPGEWMEEFKQKMLK